MKLKDVVSGRVQERKTGEAAIPEYRAIEQQAQKVVQQMQALINNINQPDPHNTMPMILDAYTACQNFELAAKRLGVV